MQGAFVRTGSVMPPNDMTHYAVPAQLVCRSRVVARIRERKMGWTMGLEPTTTGITIRGSTLPLRGPATPRPSTGGRHSEKWGGRWDSNPRRPESQSGALPCRCAAPLRPVLRLVGVTRKNGVDDGTRTHDDRNHNPGLYQLSYAHHCLPDWRARQDSNLQPSA